MPIGHERYYFVEITSLCVLTILKHAPSVQKICGNSMVWPNQFFLCLCDSSSLVGRCHLVISSASVAQVGCLYFRCSQLWITNFYRNIVQKHLAIYRDTNRILVLKCIKGYNFCIRMCGVITSQIGQNLFLFGDSLQCNYQEKQLSYKLQILWIYFQDTCL